MSNNMQILNDIYNILTKVKNFYDYFFNTGDY